MQKQIISTSEQLEEHPFAGRNTQHLHPNQSNILNSFFVELCRLITCPYFFRNKTSTKKWFQKKMKRELSTNEDGKISTVEK